MDVQVDPRLRSIIAGAEESGWAAEICDAEWRYVWVSSQMRAIIGNPDDETIGVGMPLLQSRLLPYWTQMIDEDSQGSWIEANLPHMLADTEPEELVPIAPDAAEVIRAAEPDDGAIWTSQIVIRDVEPEMRIRYFGVRMRTSVGEPVGTVYLYGSALPATLLNLVARGNGPMFERMAQLAEPGRREAAVLFADLQSSGALSRRLSSTAYFELIRTLTTAMDDVIADAGGIVGKHAGDGVTAFFIAEQYESPSKAALACLEAARGLTAVARETAAMIEQVGPDDMLLNIGTHWGATLYMGQLVTGGRLEVTALGDEVNEGARIQETARGGQVLASKALVERLTTGDAARIGIDPPRVSYCALAEMTGVSEKAVRDAGTIAVAELPR